MNLVETFQDLVSQVPELLQPLIIALAGAIPFIEGEGAATIGIIGGLHPAIAIIAGIIGNFVSVALVVLLGSGARRAVVSSRGRARAANGEPADTAPPASPRREKFQRAFERYGVPGVSLLGPLLLPTQITATMLAASGVSKGRILFWQGLAIIIWTTVIALLINTVFGAIN